MRSKLPSFRADQRLASRQINMGDNGYLQLPELHTCCWSSKPTSLDMNIAYKT
jgi:hypothetical protein